MSATWFNLYRSRSRQQYFPWCRVSPSQNVLHRLCLELAAVPSARPFVVQLLCDGVAAHTLRVHLPNPHHYRALCVVLVRGILTIRPSRDASEAGSTIAYRGEYSVPKRSREVDGFGCNCLNSKGWALNSAVECHLHTVEVIGSNPIAPTNFSMGYEPYLPFHLPFRASIATLPLASRMSGVTASP